MKQIREKIASLGLAILVTGLFSTAEAQVVLHDGNSTALINPGSQAGMFHWDVQGQNQLQQQWFWVGLGNGPVFSLDALGPAIVTPIGANETKLTYVSAGNFSVTIDYLLTGGNIVGAGQHATADISESIKIVNLSGSQLPLHFYQYSYFNLNGQSSDTVQLGQNLHGLFNEASQSSGPNGLTETVVTPGANAGEVAPVGGTLAKLNSGGPVQLGPPFFSGPLGPGAVTWALQWDFLMNGGGSQLISKDKYLDVLIPEPSALALLGLGGAALALYRRRK